MEKIGFWKVDNLYGEFSNWWLCSFVYKGQFFISSEQALMWEKAKMFGDEEVAERILSTTDQKAIKDLGRQVKNFSDIIWSHKRYYIMRDILLEKFGQNKVLSDLLLSTKNAELFEASPFDKVWGIGSSDVNIVNGQNLLGKALMYVRTYLTAKQMTNNKDEHQ